MITAVLLVTLSTGPGFVRSFNQDGNSIKWTQDDIGVWLAPELRPTFGAPLEKAVATWNRPDCVVRKLSVVSDTKDADVVIDVTSPWTAGKKVPAYTEVDSQPSGKVDRARVFINTALSYGPGKDQLDPHAIMAHEMGHVVGLAHSRSRLALMYAGIHLGKGRQAVLTPDDARAACVVLGQGPDRKPDVTGTIASKRDFEEAESLNRAPAPKSDEPTSKCSCKTTPSGAPALWGVGFATLWWGTRRRRRRAI